MKKILFFIALVISFAASAQLPVISGVTNRNTREQVIDGHFYHGLWVPKDTAATSDSGLIAYKNGNYQFKLPDHWAAMANLILTNAQPLDHIALFDATGNTLINVPGAPASSCIVFDDGWYPTVVDLDSLSYYVTESHFTVTSTGVHYIIPGAVVTLPVGNASAGQERKDYVGIGPGGPTSLQGTNGTVGVAATPEITDPCDFYPLIQVDIEEADVVASVPSTIRKVYDEHTGPAAEATMSSFGGPTINFDQTTGAPPSGTKDINITSAANLAGFRATYADTIFSSTLSSIYGRFRTNANLNGSTNFSVRLRFGTLVSNLVQVTARGVAKTGQNNIWQYFAFNMSDFPGFNRFTAIDFIRVGTGSINVFWDAINLQKIGASVIPASQAALTTINAQTGSYTATGPGSVLNVIGTDGISTSQAGNTLTIHGSSSFGQNIYNHSDTVHEDRTIAVEDGFNLRIETSSVTSGFSNAIQLLGPDGGPLLSSVIDNTHNSTMEITPTAFILANITGSVNNIISVGDTVRTFSNTVGGFDTLNYSLENLPYGDPSVYTKMLVWDPLTGLVGQVDVSGGGGGGGSDSPGRINGTATGDVTADMADKNLSITGTGEFNFLSHNGVSAEGSFLDLQHNSAQLTYQDAGFNSTTINIDATGAVVNIPTGKIFAYDHDGSADYTSLSLITRADAPAIETGIVAPVSTPTKIGDIFIDTVLKKLYVATGTSSSADWTITN